MKGVSLSCSQMGHRLLVIMREAKDLMARDRATGRSICTDCTIIYFCKLLYRISVKEEIKYIKNLFICKLFCNFNCKNFLLKKRKYSKGIQKVLISIRF